MLNVRHLAVFRAVMQIGTVSGAARMLHVSQPAVTKSLQLLEARLSVTLFERLKGRLQPTPDCEIPIERLFSDIDAVEHLADEVRRGQVGHLKIATVSNVAATAVTTAVSRFTQMRPRVRVDIHVLATRMVLREVSNNQVDLGVLDVPLAAGHCEAVELCRAEAVCVVPSQHPLASKAHVTAADLAEQRIISFAHDTVIGWMFREAFGAKRIPFPVCIVTNQTAIACALVSQGAGIALVDPFVLLPTAPAGLTMVPFRPAIDIRPTVICPPTRPVSVVADEFINTLQATMNDLLKKSRLTS